MGGGEEALVHEAFETNWVAPLGPLVNRFENLLASYHGVGHAAALGSGTAAIHLALLMLDVKPGDYVICQSMTFAASANPIRYLGAIPVFVDSEPQTWNMCPDLLEEAILACSRGDLPGRNPDKGEHWKPAIPKAIIPVHLYGMPSDMGRIMSIAGRYGIPVIEDAAEALGSEINGKKCGSFGTMGILSFNGNKIITTSGGGALLSDNPVFIDKAHFLASQARDKAPHYEHTEIGYNYRMSNVLAGIGCGQMQVLPERIARRRANYSFYSGLLAGKPGISFSEEPHGYFSNRWLTTILVDPAETGGLSRESIRLGLEQDNIESRPLWKPMHLQPVYQGFPWFGNGVSERLFANGLCLPSGSSLTNEDRERIAGVLDGLMPV